MFKFPTRLAPALALILSASFNVDAQQLQDDQIPAELVRVVDGSQIIVRVALAHTQQQILTVKLMGIDTPKLTGACPQERHLAQRAKSRLKSILQKPLILTGLSELENSSSFLAQVTTSDGMDPVSQLTSEGLARLYWGGHAFGWCKDQTTCLTQACKRFDQSVRSD